MLEGSGVRSLRIDQDLARAHEELGIASKFANR